MKVFGFVFLLLLSLTGAFIYIVYAAVPEDAPPVHAALTVPPPFYGDPPMPETRAAVQPDTMVCKIPTDLAEFWQKFNAAVMSGQDSGRWQAIGNALARSCRITSSYEQGVVVQISGPDNQYIKFQPDEGFVYWVQTASVQP